MCGSWHLSCPAGVTMLEPDHWLQQAVYQAAAEFAAQVNQMKDVVNHSDPVKCEYLKGSALRKWNCPPAVCGWNWT